VGLLAALVVWGCVREAPIPIAGRVTRASVWVDAYAPEGGDGTKERPLKRLPVEVPAPADFHLATGLYEGPFHFADDVRLEGHGQAVLHAAAPAVVVDGAGVELVRVSVQGGGVGLRVSGDATLDAVHVSGHQKVGVELLPGARVRAAALEVVGSIPESVGVKATGATLTLEGAHFLGDLRHGVRLEGATATLSGLRSEGGQTLVHAKDSTLTLLDTRALGGVGPAVLVSGGSARIEGLTVEWHSVALNVTAGAEVHAKALRSRRAHETGVVFLASKGTLQDVEVVRPGNGGGLQLLDSDVTVEDLHVEDAPAMGVFVRKGRARLKRLILEGVTSEANSDGTRSLGDALMLRDAEVDVEDAWVRDVEGSALYASAYAKVTVGTLSCERSGGGAAVVERGARLTAKTLSSKGALGPAVSVLEDGSLDVERLVVSGGAEVPIYAACAERAAARVGALDTSLTQPALPCVRLGK